MFIVYPQNVISSWSRQSPFATNIGSNSIFEKKNFYTYAHAPNQPLRDTG